MFNAMGHQELRLMYALQCSCMGIGEEHPFNIPAMQAISYRLRTNLQFFLVNYFIMIFGVLFFVLYVENLQYLCKISENEYIMLNHG